MHSELNKKAAEIAEGKLYINRFFTSMDSETFFLHEEYYTVKNGEVCRIFNGKLESTGDSAVELIGTSKCIGIVNENNLPKSVVYEVEVSDIIKKLNLEPINRKK